MQVIAFHGTESVRTEGLLRQSFKLRAQVFQSRLHWDVRVSGGQERDIFDRLQPTYLAAVTPDDTVAGSVRLLPADGPTMMSTIFSNLLGDRPVVDLRPFVEASRFCVDTARHRNGHVLHDATRSLFAEMVEWSLHQGHAGIVVVVDPRMERVLRRAGWMLARLGIPHPMGITSGVAGMLAVSTSRLRFSGVPENEFSMMTIARMMGVNIPEMQLVNLDAVSGLPPGLGELQGQSLAIRRFDRTAEGPVHIEDFAQVFSVKPDDKYSKGNYRSIARVLGIETGPADVAEFIRRLVFSTLIGNGDMHLKNWSLIYPDRRTPALSPAYDLLSTIPYIEGEDTAALNFSRTKKMTALSLDELTHLAAKAELSEKLVLATARETVERFREAWNAEKANLPMADKVRDMIDAHAPLIELYRECS